MIIAKHNGEIADWWFEGKEIEKLIFSKQDCLNLLERINKTVKILNNAELLYPKTIYIRAWAMYDFDCKMLIRVEKEELLMEVNNLNFEEALFSLCTSNEDECFLYPLEIDVSGDGAIFNKTNEKTIWPDVINICGQTQSKHIIDVITYSYAWLPYNLKGEDQSEIWSCNSPRLEKALEKIQHHPGFMLIPDSNSEYARIEKYKLSNHADADGEIITFDVL